MGSLDLLCVTIESVYVLQCSCVLSLFFRSLIKSKIMPALVESEEEEEEDVDNKDPLPDILQSSVVQICFFFLFLVVSLIMVDYQL